MKKFKFAKRAICFSISLLMVLSMAACGGTDKKTAESTASVSSQTTEATQSSVQAAKDPFEKYSPEIEITGFKPIGVNTKFESGETIDNNRWTQLYKDELGINLKWTWTADEATQYYNKLNIAIASGELADFFVVNGKQFKALAKSGMLADMSTAFEEYASPFYKQMMSDFQAGFESGKVDGKLVGLSNQGDYAGQSLMIWIRQDWMQKLGLSAPKTMDDFVKIAEAFTKQDPDGNGKSDTYGLAVTQSYFGGFQGDYLMGLASLEGFFNGYHAYPSIWIKDSNNKLVYGSVQPEMKNALAKLQEMFKAGLIDKEFGIKDPNKVAEDITKGKIGMSIGMYWNQSWPFNDMLATNQKAVWKPYPLVSVDDKPALAENPWPVTNYLVVNKNCKNPEAVVKMVNLYCKYLLDPNVSTETTEKYKMSKDGKTNYAAYAACGVNDSNAEMRDFARYNSALKNRSDATLRYESGPNKGQINQLYMDNYNKILNYVDKGVVTDNCYEYYIRMAADDGAFAIMRNYIDNNLLMLNKMPGVGTDTYLEKKSTLLKLEQEVLTKIIMGLSPVDDFDKFVADWKKLGGDKITEEVNATYNQ